MNRRHFDDVINKMLKCVNACFILYVHDQLSCAKIIEIDQDLTEF